MVRCCRRCGQPDCQRGLSLLVPADSLRRQLPTARVSPRARRLPRHPTARLLCSLLRSPVRPQVMSWCPGPRPTSATPPAAWSPASAPSPTVPSRTPLRLPAGTAPSCSFAASSREWSDATRGCPPCQRLAGLLRPRSQTPPTWRACSSRVGRCAFCGTSLRLASCVDKQRAESRRIAQDARSHSGPRACLLRPDAAVA